MDGTYRLAAILLCAAASTAAGQNPGGGNARVVGSVLDSATLAPIPGVHVCVQVPTLQRGSALRCGRVTLTGEYEINDLPAGRFVTRASCSAIMAPSVMFEGDSITLGERTQARRDWRINPRGCDPRRPRTVTGTFRGHYTPGFESSEFVPCPADAWFLPSDSLHLYPYDARDAWVELSDSALRGGMVWPDVPRDPYGNPRNYAQLRGTIHGPGFYGHLGVSVFEFVVDSILVIREPATGDCR